MRFLSALICLIVTYVVAIFASTIILRVPVFSWVLGNYGWSEIAINIFASVAGILAGLAASDLIRSKFGEQSLSRVSRLVFAVPFAATLSAAYFLSGNVMGLIGGVVAILAAGLVSPNLDDGVKN
jgi:hypothetical protein